MQGANSEHKPSIRVWLSDFDQSHKNPHFRRRKEFAPHIIGSSAILGGSAVALRRGRIAGIFGASAAGAAAYGVVYDEISFDKVPDMIFGKND